MRVFLFALFFALCACAAKRTAPPACEQYCVLLPDNFIIELAAGSRIVLDPAVQDFALFCGPDEARQRLGELALPGSWSVYKLENDGPNLARPVGADEYALARPAQVADWVE